MLSNSEQGDIKHYYGYAKLTLDDQLAIVAATGLALALPFALVAPRGVGHVGWLLVGRPLHIESLGGSILLAAHRLGVYEPTIYISVGASWDLAGPAARAVAIVGSLAEGAALIAVWVILHAP